MQALLLPVGDEWHSLDLAVVREVVRALPITAVPRGPSWLLGLVNLRGDIVPVIDSAGALGVRDPGEPTHLTVADTPNGRAAVAATGAPEQVTLGDPAGTGETRGALGRFAVGDRVTTLLDLDDLVRRP